jgi:AcrR family transcriptional regulator
VEQLLREKTIAQLSVEDIAAAAGISRSGFYFYFESKYAALGDALTDVGDAMRRAADDFFGGSNEPPERYLPLAIGGVADLWRRHAALLVAVVDAAHSDAGARTLWNAWVERFVAAARRSIDAERVAGRSALPATDVPDVARSLLIMDLALLDDNVRRRVSDADTERMVSALVHIWLSAVWGINHTG